MRRFWLGMTVVFTLFVVYATLFPFLNGAPLSNLKSLEFWVLRTYPKSDIADWVANLVFFLPIGYSLTKAFMSMGFPKWGIVFLVPIYGAALSYFVECLQQLSYSRNPSRWDVVSNFISTILGTVLALAWKWPIQLIYWKRKFRQSFRSRWTLPFLMALLFLVLDGTQPFDFSLSTKNLGQRENFLNFLSWKAHTEYYVLWWRMVLTCSITAAIGCAWFLEQRIKYYGRKIILLHLGLGFLLESLQYIIVSRSPGLGEFLAYGVGSIFGVFLYKSMPQKKIKYIVFFWGFIGLGLGQALHPVWFNNIDSFQLTHFNSDPILVARAFWVSKVLSYLFFFSFAGFLIAYWVFRLREFPKTMVGAGISFIFCLFLSLLLRDGFYRFVVSLKGGIVALGIMGGVICFIWLWWVAQGTKIRGETKP